MEKAINYMKIIAWESIILGAFMMVKIPEAIINFFISTRLSEEITARSPQEIIQGLVGDFSWMAVAIIIFSCLLIVGGAFMLYGKRFGRTTLEYTYWLLFLVIAFNLITVIYTGIRGGQVAAAPIYFSILILPFIFLLTILTANIIMLRNNDLKRFLNE